MDTKLRKQFLYFSKFIVFFVTITCSQWCNGTQRNYSAFKTMHNQSKGILPSERILTSEAHTIKLNNRDDHNTGLTQNGKFDQPIHKSDQMNSTAHLYKHHKINEYDSSEQRLRPVNKNSVTSGLNNSKDFSTKNNRNKKRFKGKRKKRCVRNSNMLTSPQISPKLQNIQLPLLNANSDSCCEVINRLIAEAFKIKNNCKCSSNTVINIQQNFQPSTDGIDKSNENDELQQTLGDTTTNNYNKRSSVGVDQVSSPEKLYQDNKQPENQMQTNINNYYGSISEEETLSTESESVNDQIYNTTEITLQKPNMISDIGNNQKWTQTNLQVEQNVTEETTITTDNNDVTFRSFSVKTSKQNFEIKPQSQHQTQPLENEDETSDYDNSGEDKDDLTTLDHNDNKAQENPTSTENETHNAPDNEPNQNETNYPLGEGHKDILIPTHPKENDESSPLENSITNVSHKHDTPTSSYINEHKDLDSLDDLSEKDATKELSQETSNPNESTESRKTPYNNEHNQNQTTDTNKTNDLNRNENFTQENTNPNMLQENSNSNVSTENESENTPYNNEHNQIQTTNSEKPGDLNENENHNLTTDNDTLEVFENHEQNQNQKDDGPVDETHKEDTTTELEESDANIHQENDDPNVSTENELENTHYDNEHNQIQTTDSENSGDLNGNEDSTYENANHNLTTNNDTLEISENHEQNQNETDVGPVEQTHEDDTAIEPEGKYTNIPHENGNPETLTEDKLQNTPYNNENNGSQTTDYNPAGERHEDDTTMELKGNDANISQENSNSNVSSEHELENTPYNNDHNQNRTTDADNQGDLNKNETFTQENTNHNVASENDSLEGFNSNEHNQNQTGVGHVSEKHEADTELEGKDVNIIQDGSNPEVLTKNDTPSSINKHEDTQTADFDTPSDLSQNEANVTQDDINSNESINTLDPSNTKDYIENQIKDFDTTGEEQNENETNVAQQYFNSNETITNDSIEETYKNENMYTVNNDVINEYIIGNVDRLDVDEKDVNVTQHVSNSSEPNKNDTIGAPKTNESNTNQSAQFDSGTGSDDAYRKDTDHEITEVNNLLVPTLNETLADIHDNKLSRNQISDVDTLIENVKSDESEGYQTENTTSDMSQYNGTNGEESQTLSAPYNQQNDTDWDNKSVHFSNNDKPTSNERTENIKDEEDYIRSYMNETLKNSDTDSMSYPEMYETAVENFDNKEDLAAQDPNFNETIMNENNLRDSEINSTLDPVTADSETETNDKHVTNKSEPMNDEVNATPQDKPMALPEVPTLLVSGNSEGSTIPAAMIFPVGLRLNNPLLFNSPESKIYIEVNGDKFPIEVIKTNSLFNLNSNQIQASNKVTNVNTDVINQITKRNRIGTLCAIKNKKKLQKHNAPATHINNYRHAEYRNNLDDTTNSSHTLKLNEQEPRRFSLLENNNYSQNVINNSNKVHENNNMFLLDNENKVPNNYSKSNNYTVNGIMKKSSLSDNERNFHHINLKNTNLTRNKFHSSTVKEQDRLNLIQENNLNPHMYNEFNKNLQNHSYLHTYDKNYFNKENNIDSRSSHNPIGSQQLKRSLNYNNFNRFNLNTDERIGQFSDDQNIIDVLYTTVKRIKELFKK